MSREAFEYAVLRVIPRVDRGEAMNAGVVLYCRPLRYLAARTALDERLLLAMDPDADAAGVSRALAAVAEVCAGRGSHSAAGQDIGRRFRWLTAPRSTVVQPGPVHTGLTSDPEAEIDSLLRALVHRPGSTGPAARARQHAARAREPRGSPGGGQPVSFEAREPGVQQGVT